MSKLYAYEITKNGIYNVSYDQWLTLDLNGQNVLLWKQYKEDLNKGTADHVCHYKDSVYTTLIDNH